MLNCFLGGCFNNNLPACLQVGSYTLLFFMFFVKKSDRPFISNRNNSKHRNMNNNLNYNGQSSIDRINEVIERNKKIVEELNAMYDLVRRF